jgi:uncharacterized membrane protein YqjE
MPQGSDRSFSEVIEDVVTHVQEIIRSEVRLAKVEVREEAVKAGKAAGILAAGAIIGVYALGFFFLTWLYALEIAITPWLAGLIVTILVGSIGAALIMIGIKRIKRVNPRPTKTLDSLKEDVEWAKQQVR